MKLMIKQLLRENLLCVKVNKFEYQVRDIGGSYVYYKRKKGDDIWLFVDKKEFDKNSNKNNIVKNKPLKESLETKLKKQYIGQCDLLRHKCVENEGYWHEMMKNKYRISFKEFISSVDMARMLDDDETPSDYIKDALKQDISTAAYISNWGDKECMFLQTAGFEFIFV